MTESKITCDPHIYFLAGAKVMVQLKLAYRGFGNVVNCALRYFWRLVLVHVKCENGEIRTAAETMGCEYLW